MIYQKTLFENSELGEISLFVFGNQYDENIAVDTEWVYKKNDGNELTSKNFTDYIQPRIYDFGNPDEYLHINLNGEWYWLNMTKYKEFGCYNGSTIISQYYYESLIGLESSIVDPETVYSSSIRFKFNSFDEEQREEFLNTYGVDPKTITVHFSYQPRLDTMIVGTTDKNIYGESDKINMVSKFHKEKKCYSFRLDSLKEIPSNEPLYEKYRDINTDMHRPGNKNNYIEYYPTPIYPTDFGKPDNITNLEPGKDTLVVYIPNIYSTGIDDEGNNVVFNDMDVIAETGKFLVFLNGVKVDYTVIDTDTPIVNGDGRTIYKRIKIEGYGSILKRKYMTLEDGTVKSYRDDVVKIYFWDGVRYDVLVKDPVYSTYRYDLKLFQADKVYYSFPSKYTYYNSLESPIMSRPISKENCLVFRNGNMMISEVDYKISDNSLYTLCEKSLPILDFELQKNIYSVNIVDDDITNKYDMNRYRCEFEDYLNSLLSLQVLFFYDESTKTPVIMDMDETDMISNCPKIGEITVKNHDMSTPIFTGNHIGDFEFINTEPDGTAALTDGEYSGQKRTVLKTPVTESLLENMYEQSFEENIDFNPVENSGIKFSPKHFLNKIAQFRLDNPDFTCEFTHVMEQAVRFAFCSNKVSSREIKLEPFDETKDDTEYMMVNISDDDGVGISRSDSNYIMTCIHFKYSEIDKLFTFGLTALDSGGNYNYHEDIGGNNGNRSCFLLVVLLKNGKFGVIPFTIIYRKYGSDAWYKVSTMRHQFNEVYNKYYSSNVYEFDLLQHLCNPFDTYYTRNNEIGCFLIESTDYDIRLNNKSIYSGTISLKELLEKLSYCSSHLTNYEAQGEPYEGDIVQVFQDDGGYTSKSLYEIIYLPNETYFSSRGLSPEEMEIAPSEQYETVGIMIFDMFKQNNDSNDNSIIFSSFLLLGHAHPYSCVVAAEGDRQSIIGINNNFYPGPSPAIFYRDSDGFIDRAVIGGNTYECMFNIPKTRNEYHRLQFPFVFATLFRLPTTSFSAGDHVIDYNSLCLSKTAHGPGFSMDFIFDIDATNNNKSRSWKSLKYPKNFNQYRVSKKGFNVTFDDEYHSILSELSRKVSYDHINDKLVFDMAIYNHTEDNKATYKTINVETDKIHSDPNKYQILSTNQLIDDKTVENPEDIIYDITLTNGRTYFQNGNYIDYRYGDVIFVSGSSKIVLGNLFKDSNGLSVDRIVIENYSQREIFNFPRENSISPSENMLVNVGFTDGYGDWVLVNQNHIQTQDEYVASKTVKDYDPYRDTPIRRLRVFEK